MRSIGIGAIMSTPTPTGKFDLGLVAHVHAPWSIGAARPCRTRRRDAMPHRRMVHGRADGAMIHAHVLHAQRPAARAAAGLRRACRRAAPASRRPCRSGRSLSATKRVGAVCRAGRSRRRSRHCRSGTRRPRPAGRRCPSAATTVIGRPGMRTLKIVCAAALMIRSRTRSPGRNRPVQFSPGLWPLMRIGVGGRGDVRDVGRVHPHLARTSCAFLGRQRIAGRSIRSASVRFWRLKKPPSCFSRVKIACGCRKLQSDSTITCSRS